MSKKFFSEIPLKAGDKIEIDITDLAYGGDSIGKYRDFIVFIPYGVPGSKLKVKIDEVKKDFARGTAISLISKSDIYKKPECNFFGICGGCDWMNIKYDEQIKYKTKIINTMLKNIAKIDFKVENFIKYKEPFFYRNRVQYKLLKDQNGIDVGFFKARSHNVVPVDKCLILYPEINEFAGKLKEFLNEFKNEIEIYDEKKQSGYLRHICVRSNEQKELLVTFVVFKNEVKPFILKIADKIKKQNNVAGFVLNINNEKGNRVFGEKERVIYGKSFITEKVKDVSFQLDSASFFQISKFMLENMIDFIEKNLTDGEKVIDLYGGVGALSLPLFKKFKEILVVEVEKNAIEKLKKTIEFNKLKNVKPVNAKAENVICRLIKEFRIKEIIIDPPRKGLHPRILADLRKNKLNKIIYISCNPASFSRDIFQLKQHYYLKKVVPLDQFSQTYHIELMALLEKKE